MEASQGKYIKATLDGREVASTWWSYEPNFLIDKILIGSGFSGSRPFNGDIKGVHLDVKHVLSHEAATYVYLIIRFILLIFFIISIAFISWPKCETYQIEKFNREYDPLLILRSIACFMVLIGHGLMINFATPNLPSLITNNSFIGLLTASPWGGVWIFFTLSGYLMGKAFFLGRYELNKIGILNFYRNRLLRILPIYFVAVLIVCIFNYSKIFYGSDFVSLVRVISVDDDGLLPISPIGSLWSISTEMQFYLMAPIMFWLINTILRKRTILLSIGFFIVLLGALYHIFTIEIFGWEFWPYKVYKTFIGNFDLFAIGFFANIFVIKHIKNSNKFGQLFGYTLLLALYLICSWVSSQGMVLYLEFWKKFLLQYMPTLVSLLTASIIFIFEITPASSKSYLSNFGKRLEIFGLLTYAIYIWHEPVFNALSKVTANNYRIVDSVQNLLVACIPLLLISFIMWKFIEVPFEKKKEF